MLGNGDTVLVTVASVDGSNEESGVADTEVAVPGSIDIAAADPVGFGLEGYTSDRYS